jgi:hypothetical protein
MFRSFDRRSSMDVEPTPLPTPQPAPLSLPQRLVGIFHRPVEVMTDLRQRPTTLPALLITLLLANIILGFGFSGFLDATIDQLYSSPGSSPEDIDQIVVWVDDHPGVTQAAYHIAVSLGLVLSLLVWAGLFHLSASMFFQPPVNRDPPQFAHSMSQVVYANLVNLPATLIIQFLVASLGRPVSAISLSLFLDADPQSMLHIALDWLNPFNLWWIGLLAVACAVNYQVSLARALIVPVGVSIVFRIIQMLLAAAGQAGAPS